MFVKLQSDTGYFQILCSTKTSPSNNIGAPVSVSVSVYPLEHSIQTINKRNQTLLQNSNVGVKKLHRQNNYNQPSLVVHKPELKEQSSDQNPVREQRKNTRVDARFFSKRNPGGGFGGVKVNGRVQTTCSTKWASYGGCIPLMLQALDTIEDLDEALKPWAEKISSKERSIILKEQSSWKRALGIYEWFKKKGCYDLNVIHYNIMLRILGKAQKWSYVESLLDEMSGEGIAPINSTYGTLIDVYSKSGLKEEAVRWLERMNEQGMEPDEVTMGIVLQMYKKAGDFQKAEEFSRSGHLDNL